MPVRQGFFGMREPSVIACPAEPGTVTAITRARTPRATSCRKRAPSTATSRARSSASRSRRWAFRVPTCASSIRRAYADYEATQFGGWPWPSTEPVHEREQGRFALRPNGAIERPG